VEDSAYPLQEPISINDYHWRLEKIWKAFDFANIKTKVTDVEKQLEQSSVLVKINKTHYSESSQSGFKTTEDITIHSDGSILIETEVNPFGEGIPFTLPRIGYEVQMNKDIVEASWYGKGPGSSYIDRNHGMMYGIYSDHIDDMFVNYARHRRTATDMESAGSKFRVLLVV
jgi:beta-galactosidase